MVIQFTSSLYIKHSFLTQVSTDSAVILKLGNIHERLPVNQSTNL